MATHGWRIEQLGASESLTVSVEFTAPDVPRSRAVGVRGGNRAGAFGLTSESDLARLWYAQESGPGSAPSAVISRQVIVQASKSDLEAVHAGRIDAEAFKRRARVTEYESPAPIPPPNADYGGATTSGAIHALPQGVQEEPAQLDSSVALAPATLPPGAVRNQRGR